MKTPDLKPCPFCGGKAITSEEAGINPRIPGCGWVGCQCCRVFMEYTHGDKGKKLAIDAWNRRANDESERVP